MIGKALKALQESGGKHVVTPRHGPRPNPNPTQAKIIMAGRVLIILACFSLVLHAGQHARVFHRQ